MGTKMGGFLGAGLDPEFGIKMMEIQVAETYERFNSVEMNALISYNKVYLWLRALFSLPEEDFSTVITGQHWKRKSAPNFIFKIYSESEKGEDCHSWLTNF